MRALYKVQTCPLCKTDCPQVVYTDVHDSEFNTYKVPNMKSDRKLGIFFKTKEMHDETLKLLAFNCPDNECSTVCGGGWGELRNHIKKVHDSLLCELCTRHKKVFIHEHTLYTTKTLKRHNKEGDPDDPSFKGHPDCGFCHTRFYGLDELYDHLVHFTEEHFLCREQRCIDQKFVVFGSDLDLQGHMLQEHGDTKAKAKGKAIQLDFNYSGSGTTRSRDEEVRRGRQRSDRPETQSSSPATNAADNFSVLGGQRRGFSGNLTETTNPTPAELSAPAPIELTPAQDNALADASPELSASLEKIFKSNENFFAQFKIMTASFKNSTLTANAFLKEFVNLSLKNNQSVQKELVMNEVHRAWQKLAETFPEEPQVQANQKKPKKKGMSIEEFEAMKRSEPKKTAMLRAWNDHKATMQQENDAVYVKPSNWAQPPAPKKKPIPQPTPTVNPNPKPATWQRSPQVSIESLAITPQNEPKSPALPKRNTPSLSTVVKSGFANPAANQFPSLPSSSKPAKANARINATITSSKTGWARQDGQESDKGKKKG
ncbi:hypothetical protein HDV01_006785 [Terramyces sp. JEL0728]|nr:hypothetical protein HDV01_006785 [Terramyces sp. JEL0728]